MDGSPGAVAGIDRGQSVRAGSWGARLLPFAFAALETCWVAVVLVGLAGIHFFQISEPLIPLWGPLLLIGGTYWLVTRLERGAFNTHGLDTKQEGEKRGSAPLFALLTVMTLLIIWASVYASSRWVIDPRWLLMLLNDVLLLTPTAYRVMMVVIVSAYFCWRGMRLTRRIIEPGDVRRAIFAGVAAFSAVMVLHGGASAGQGSDLQILILIPLFIAAALFAHTLAHTLFIRHGYGSGLQGSVTSQERALVIAVGGVCVFLALIAFGIGSIAHPAFLEEVRRILAPVGKLYDWIVNGIAYVIVLILIPIYWLLSQLHMQMPDIHNPFTQLNQGHGKGVKGAQDATPAAVATAVAVMKVVVPLLFIALLVFLIWRFWRRRRRVLELRPNEDVEESLWSWGLFWAQLQAVLRLLWGRFLRKRTAQDKLEKVLIAEIADTRSIRGIYRAFLQWTAGRGYGRKRDETPYEFGKRLDQHWPYAREEIDTVTEAYIAERYDEAMMEEGELGRVRQSWEVLRQKAER